MCLIIQKPAGQVVPMSVITSAASRNSDGFGIMVNGTFDKWLTITDKTIKEKIDALKDVDCGIHFRMATDGPVNRKMAHPFKLRDKSLLMHNGVLSGYRTGASGKVSDTVKFIKTFVNPHIKKNGTLCAETVSDAAGYSAFLLMNEDGTMERFGSGWCEHYGLHFSNEYAWNAPHKKYEYASYDDYDYGTSQYRGSSSARAAASYWRKDISTSAEIDTETQNLLCGEMIRRLLLDWSDSVNPGYNDVSYGDGDALDSVYAGEISMDEYISVADGESLMRMFGILARDHAIQRHI